jgi:hypothetical protein
MVNVSPLLTSTLQEAHIKITYLLKNYSLYDLFDSGMILVSYFCEHSNEHTKMKQSNHNVHNS